LYIKVGGLPQCILPLVFIPGIETNYLSPVNVNHRIGVNHREKIQRLVGLNLPHRENIKNSRVESTIERRYRD